MRAGVVIFFLATTREVIRTFVKNRLRVNIDWGGVGLRRGYGAVGVGCGSRVGWVGVQSWAMAEGTNHVDLSALKDEQLVVAYREGEVAALGVLIGRYEKELFHFLVRFAGNRAFAEDLFQETFLQIHQSAKTFDASKRFKPWLFTIAANKARDHLRREKRRRTAPLSAMVDPNAESGTTFVDLMEADIPLPDMTADDAEIAGLVRELADQLPDHLREVLVMAYFHQFAYKEIAAMLSIPLGTVKSRLHAAVGTFAQLWKARYGTSAPGSVEAGAADAGAAGRAGGSDAEKTDE